MKMNKNKGITFSIVFLANSANYGEGIGNVSVLKKITRGNGEQYTYISRQALRYNIVEQLGYNLAPVEDKAVIQFSPKATIKDYPELDFFGYLKTMKKSESVLGSQSRSAIVRISDAISLEAFKEDLDYLTNIGLAKRISRTYGNIAQSEIHRSYYSYTVTIDLDKVGVDEKGESQISQKEKIERVNRLLEVIATLYRDIKGRRENLRPLFVIGGSYDSKNPFFQNMIDIKNNKINIEKISDSIYDFIKKDTNIGMIKKQFDNDEEIREQMSKNGIEVSSVSEFFQNLKEKVKEYYESC